MRENASQPPQWTGRLHQTAASLVRVVSDEDDSLSWHGGQAKHSESHMSYEL